MSYKRYKLADRHAKRMEMNVIQQGMKWLIVMQEGRR